jgi:cysteinyl-tRNA synthetase
MSKSLGNFFTVREIAAITPGAVRMFLLSAQYVAQSTSAGLIESEVLWKGLHRPEQRAVPLGIRAR